MTVLYGPCIGPFVRLSGCLPAGSPQCPSTSETKEVCLKRLSVIVLALFVPLAMQASQRVMVIEDVTAGRTAEQD